MKQADKILNKVGINRVALNKGSKYSKGFMEDGNIGEALCSRVKSRCWNT
nr:hypothetical protein [Staphylococcus sp. NRL 22/194]